MAKALSFSRVALLSMMLAGLSGTPIHAQTPVDSGSGSPLLRPTADPDATETVPIRRAVPEPPGSRPPRRIRTQLPAPGGDDDVQAPPGPFDGEAQGLPPLSAETQAILDDLRRREEEDLTRVEDTGEPAPPDTVDLAAPQPAQPARANPTRQLDEPPVADGTRLARPGEAIPERPDTPVQAPVASLSTPPVFELPETGPPPGVDDVDPPAPVDAADIDPYAPRGITAGWLRLFPAVELRGGFTSNAGGVGDAGGDSAFLLFSPEVTIETLWARHALSAEVRGSLSRFASAGENDEQTFLGALRGRIDITDRTRLELEVGYERELLQRGDTGVPTTAGSRPNLHTRSAGATLTQDFNRLTLSLSGGVTEFDYENTRNRDGTPVDNSDLDFRIEDIGLRGTYEISPKTDVFAEVFADREVYEREVSSAGIRQGSTGFGALAGATWRPSAAIELNGAVGYEVREPEESGAGTIDALLVEGGAVWRPREATTVALQLRQSLDTSNEDGTSDGVLIREATLAAEHQIGPAVTVNGELTIARETFQGSNREDDSIGASAGLIYRINRYLAFIADVIHERTESNVAGEDDEETEVSAGLRWQF